MIDDSDFREGFIQGYRAVMGTARTLPSLPSQPATISGKTPFQMGIRKGVTKGCEQKGMEAPQY